MEYHLLPNGLELKHKDILKTGKESKLKVYLSFCALYFFLSKSNPFSLQEIQPTVKIKRH